MIHTADGQQVDALVGHPKVNLVREQPGRGAVRYYLMNTAKPPLDDIRARRAIALAIDRHQINELRNGGIFEVADGPFDRSVAGYMKDPGYPHYNPKESARLVEAYKAEHDGGFHVVLAHTNDPADAAEAELVKVQLGHVGIDATLQQLDQTAFIPTAVAGNFSILLWRNHPGDDPDVNYQWWSRDSRLNFGRIDDPKLQQLLDQGRGETDPVKRRRIYERVNEEFSAQLFNVWVYRLEWVVAANRRVHGLTGAPLPEGGGRPLIVYGRHPLLSIYVAG